jgi:hypothetical protein
MRRFRKSPHTKREFYDGKHRFEHRNRDNTIYPVTSRTRDRTPAFGSEETKSIFRDRFDHHAGRDGFRPIVGSPLDNHDHEIGYLESLRSWPRREWGRRRRGGARAAAGGNRAHRTLTYTV